MTPLTFISFMPAKYHVGDTLNSAASSWAIVTAAFLCCHSRPEEGALWISILCQRIPVVAFRV